MERGLTRARAAVIWQLQERGPVTQRTLSQALRVSPRNVTGLLDALEAGGYVTRGSPSHRPTGHAGQPHRRRRGCGQAAR